MKNVISIGILSLLFQCSTGSQIDSSKISENLEKVRNLEPFPGISVEEWKLKSNGLKIILIPNTAKNIVTMVTAFDVGSRHEKPGATGLAHLFEHMMFRGTPSFPSPFQQLSDWGADYNAFTSSDSTVYHQTFPKDLLGTLLHFESERMSQLILDDTIFNTERGAVVSERKMSVSDNPRGRLFWELNQLAFDEHSYKTNPIGWQEDLDKMTAEDARLFYKTHYAPNLAILALSGDFEVPQALALIEKHYGKIARGPERTLSISPEPNLDNRKSRLKKIPMKVENVFVMDTFVGPSLSHTPIEELATMSLYCYLISDSAKGLFEFELVQKGIAKKAMASCSPEVDPSAVGFYLEAYPGVSSQKLISSYERALSKFESWFRSPLAKAKLSRLEQAKLAYESHELWTLREAGHLAMNVATEYQLTGDPLFSLKFLNAVKSVKEKDILKLSQKFRERLKKNNVRVIIEPSQTNSALTKEANL